MGVHTDTEQGRPQKTKVACPVKTKLCFLLAETKSDCQVLDT